MKNQLNKININKLYYTYYVYNNLVKSNQKPKCCFYHKDGELEKTTYNIVIKGQVITKTDSKLKDTAGPTGAYLGWLRLQDFINNYARYINTLIDRYNAGEDLEKLEQQAILNYVLNWNKMLAENGLEYVR